MIFTVPIKPKKSTNYAITTAGKLFSFYLLFFHAILHPVNSCLVSINPFAMQSKEFSNRSMAHQLFYAQLFQSIPTAFSFSSYSPEPYFHQSKLSASTESRVDRLFKTIRSLKEKASRAKDRFELYTVKYEMKAVFREVLGLRNVQLTNFDVESPWYNGKDKL